jgi:hypothetical protein
MRWFPSVRYPLVAVVVAVGSVAPAWGQTTLLNTNGFEQPTFFPTLLTGQQSFTVAGSATAASVQTGTVFAGSQAVQISGPALTDTAFSGGNFWYQAFSSGAGYNPTANGTRYVQASAMVRTSGLLVNGAPLPNDIPFAGLHFETWSNHTNIFGQLDQQSLTPVQVSALGEVMVFSNTATAGSSNSLFTAPGLAHREQWQKLAVEFDFQNQTFRVYLDDMTTPLQFIRNGNNGPVSITDVPFRNSLGTSMSIAEQGVVAYYGHDLSTGFAPGNNFFVDDYLITASANQQLGAPVPEPGLMVAAGFAAVAAGGALRRWRRVKPRAA